MDRLTFTSEEMIYADQSKTTFVTNLKFNDALVIINGDYQDYEWLCKKLKLGKYPSQMFMQKRHIKNQRYSSFPTKNDYFYITLYEYATNVNIPISFGCSHKKNN